MFDVPVYCFLISNGDRHVIFDLGVRHDWENLSPATLSMLKQTKTGVHTGPNVAQIIDASNSVSGIKSTDIEAIIWSHHHFDHVGDMSTFPSSTILIVGPGVRKSCVPGFPTNPDAITLDSDFHGREVKEVKFADGQDGLRIGHFKAVDFFGDGSFYLLDAPGHCQGHMCGLARVTSIPESFVLMGGDACHHPGVLRPSEFLSLPPWAPRPFTEDSHLNAHENSGISCEGSQQNWERDHPFFMLSPFMFPDLEIALETVRKLQELDAEENVFVILAHDRSLKGEIDFYPITINDWKEKALDRKTRWLFCGDMETHEAKI